MTALGDFVGGKAGPLPSWLADARARGRMSPQEWTANTQFTPRHLKEAGFVLCPHHPPPLLAFQTYINFRLHGLRRAMASN